MANMNRKIAFLLLVFFTLLIIGCERRNQASPDQSTGQELVSEETSLAVSSYEYVPDDTLITTAVTLHEWAALPRRIIEPDELRNVIPNSWRMLTALTPQEEQTFLERNSAVISARLAEIMRFNNALGWRDGRRYEHYFIFRQIVGRDIFYRVLVTTSYNPDFLSSEISFIQLLIYDNIFLTSATYNSLVHTQFEPFSVFGSIDIIQGRENAKGILVTEVSVMRDSSNPNKWLQSAFRNGQLVDGNRSTYILMSDALRRAAGEDFSSIRIDASDSLVDPNIPLRYSLQNAFDGNRESAFITNTEDGLMEFEIQFFNFREKNTRITNFSFINGYAKTVNLHNAFNRAKSIAIWSNYPFVLQEVILEDSTLSQQIINSLMPEREVRHIIEVETVYSGSMYNKTALAEMNIELYPFGWLFGVKNE